MKTDLIRIIEIPSFVEMMANATDDKAIEIYNDRIRVLGINEYVEWQFRDCKGIMLSKNALNRVISIKFIMEKNVLKQCCGDRIDFLKPEKEHSEKFNEFTNELFLEFEKAFNNYKNL